MLALAALFFFARIGGGLMGDYGGGESPAERAEHERMMNAWFRDSFVGLGLSIALAFWWSKSKEG